MENDNNNYTILISFLRSWSHIPSSATMISEKVEISVKLLFSFYIIVFNIMELLVILFMIKLFPQMNVFKKV